MTMEAAAREPDPPRVDLWALPEIRSIEIVRVRLREPIRRYGPDGRLRQYRETVELTVRTAVPLPERAQTPALFVGDVPIVTYEELDNNVYRFIAFDLEGLADGAPISIGWPRYLATRKDTGRRFHMAQEDDN